VLTGASRADDITLESVPPVVVRTVPEAGARDVDPKLEEIKVVFSKPMQDESWSWSSLSKESFPKMNGKPKYLDDKRTCVLPVKLEPGKTYAIWVNSERFQNFKDANGQSAVPYLLVFRTKGDADKPETPAFAFSEETLGKRFDELWAEFDRHYSYFAYKKDIDWKAMKERFRPRAVQAKNTSEFVAVIKEMLEPLKDLHIWIESPDGRVGTHRSGYRRNWNRDATLEALEETTDCGFALVGKTKAGGYGYFLMVNQGKADDTGVQKALEALGKLRDAPGFVVDLRQANGGDERKAQAIAQFFCSKETLYAKSKYRNGAGHDQFTSAYERTLKASERAFTKPVVCLIGSGAVSSGEGFVQMMKCLPHVVTVGQPTRGASGNPKPFKLDGLNVSVWFSRWVDLMPDGSVFEGTGIAPTVLVDLPPEKHTGRDPTLEKGLAVLKDKCGKPEPKP
jgi:RNA polymerase sigma-70 factor (ECF subfamily)